MRVRLLPAPSLAALVATFPARRAADPGVRAAMRRIAPDETRHAALAWEVLAWGLPKLAPADRARVRRRLDEALAALGRSTALGPRARRVVGRPDPSTERRLAEGLREAVPRSNFLAAPYFTM